MINWNNLDTLASFKELKDTKAVDLVSAMSGESALTGLRALTYLWQRDLTTIMLPSR